MFSIFSKKVDNNLYAPVKGKCIDITDVSDAGFSSKIMGDGIAIIPDDNIICSPCDGELKMMFHTGHAFGITMKNGLEILVHIGIDTVNLDGKGFKILKKSNSMVKKGEPIVEIDLDLIKKEYYPSTMIIITNKKSFEKLKVNAVVDLHDKIIKAE